MQFFTAQKAAIISSQEVLERLQSNAHEGLSTQEAERRLRVHGHNEFEIATEEPLWKKYLDQVTNFNNFNNFIHFIHITKHQQHQRTTKERWKYA